MALFNSSKLTLSVPFSLELESELEEEVGFGIEIVQAFNSLSIRRWQIVSISDRLPISLSSLKTPTPTFCVPRLPVTLNTLVGWLPLEDSLFCSPWEDWDSWPLEDWESWLLEDWELWDSEDCDELLEEDSRPSLSEDLPPPEEPEELCWSSELSLSEESSDLKTSPKATVLSQQLETNLL